MPEQFLEGGFPYLQISCAFSESTGVRFSLLILVFLFVCIPDWDKPPSQPSHKSMNWCLTQIPLNAERGEETSHTQVASTMNKGESRSASSWLQLGPAGI